MAERRRESWALPSKRWARRHIGRITDQAVRAVDIRRGSLASNLLRMTGVSAPLPAYWWGRTNFGDSLAKVVLRHMSRATPVSVTRSFRGKILSVGSVLHHALAEDDVVWGSGAIEAARIVPPAGVRFLAVRGPLTRSTIEGDVPAVFGDPAALMPDIYRPRSGSRSSVGLVPHYADRGLMSVRDPAIEIIDVTRPWREIIDGITSCDVIASSSLHGLIVAEAYGIPAVWIDVSGKLTRRCFKFNDYYASTDRAERCPVAWSRGLRHVLGELTDPPKIDTSGLRAAWETWCQSWSLPAETSSSGSTDSDGASGVRTGDDDPGRCF